MFNQLIESNSHGPEFKRRGSFLFFTTVCYVVLFTVTGVVSIYAYDAHLEDQNFEEVLVMRPDELTSPTTGLAHVGNGAKPGRPTEVLIGDTKNPAK